MTSPEQAFLGSANSPRASQLRADFPKLLCSCRINPSYLEKSLGFLSQPLFQVKEHKGVRQPG